MKTYGISFLYLTLTLLAAARAEPTLQTFDTKSAFLAATGATSATGPLPNLGSVVDESGSVTVGTITFRVAPGGGYLVVGGGGSFDWYPPTPGHDLALAYEKLQVQTAAPVHSLGFEIVEPNATIPVHGGVPLPSPYVVTLYSGANVVGEFVVDVPDDVVAFVGVWSDTAFDRVTIIDSNGTDDDEYFGQFYTGTAIAPSRSFTSIAGSGTTVPGGSGGVFTAFVEGPAVGAGAVSFLGLGSLGSFGIYGLPQEPIIPQDPTRIADLSTAIPGGTGNFTGFTGLAAGGSRLSFIGTGAGQAGIYSAPQDPTAPQDPVRIADLNTAIPGGAGNFTAFTLGTESSPPSVAANGAVAFFGAGGNGQQGIYAQVNSSLVRVADTGTAIPAGTGSFTGFGDFSLCPVNARRIGFVGLGSGDQAGVYSYVGGSLSMVADTATLIPDGVGTFTGFGGLSLLPQDPSRPLRAAFMGSGTDGQQGVYSTASGSLARVADRNTPIPGGTGKFTGFGALSTASGHTAFIGLGSGGQKGIYLASGLTLVIAVGDILHGKEITDLRFGSTGLAPGGLAYLATFTDGSEGVFISDLVRYSFSGFRAPVAGLPHVNQAKAGQSIPVKFSLDGFHGFNIFAPGFPKSEPVGPGTAAATALFPGASGLKYDAKADEYSFAWKTEKRWAGTTRDLVLQLNDGAIYRARFSFK